MKFKGKFLVGGDLLIKDKNLGYQVVEKVFDFENDKDCIIVRYLNPDFTILLSNIHLIITERGSTLSHLAIISREYGKSIIRINGEIINKIPKKGKLSLSYNQKDVEIKIY